ncbi:DUF305 domain-containing protein [Arthrobacter oryzae]|uniref:DUF305 domain-containing protein n=1 Tax=Arthrobacter oryzae TaxID=409290 RepID=UPI00273B718C|nr:DUF305 domain-containing protein [Arthrobacter oryzae]WLQ07888.1 DUF305 domain-containing protein [Arthrobacter oryzae]
MKKKLTLSAAALAAVITLAGCGSNATTGSSSMPADHGAMSSGSAPSGSAAMGHNSADTLFTQSMIPHHAQAVEMSDMMLGKQGVNPAITDLATKIKAAQGPEIEQMNGWLKGWNEPTAMAGHGEAGHSMSGMMSDDDLKALDAAQGTEADKLFLTQMIAHHEGAVQMAKAQIADGQNSDAVKLAQAIITAQEAEIKQMQDLLATL